MLASVSNPMSSVVKRVQRSLLSADELEVRSLYQHLITSWNERDSIGFASGFANDGELVESDGVHVTGPNEIEAHLRRIFSERLTGRSVGKVRRVELLSPSVTLLTGISGTIPVGRLTFETELNVIQTLVAVNRDHRGWRIILFQNTPAPYHGRPDLAQEMTEELQDVL